MTVETLDAGTKKICRRAIVGAPAGELFEIVAHPARHHDLDGSGTVGTVISGAERLSPHARFTMHMKQYGMPYRITSVVTDFDEGRVVEWQHPLGHRWRWEFAPGPDGGTVVTETFDYSRLGVAKSTFLRFSRTPRKNANGIEATLSRLQHRYAGSPTGSA